MCVHMFVCIGMVVDGGLGFWLCLGLRGVEALWVLAGLALGCLGVPAYSYVCSDVGWPVVWLVRV